jgi:hypothetical protein
MLSQQFVSMVAAGKSTLSKAFFRALIRVQGDPTHALQCMPLTHTTPHT